MNHRFLLLSLALLPIGCFADTGPAPEPIRKPVTDSPRVIDGRLEPTPAAGPKWSTAAERLDLIQQAQAKRLELLQRFPPPTTLCRRVPDGAIKVDGQLDDPAWQTIPAIGPFREVRRLEPEKLPTLVKLAYDSQYLYFAFDCLDTDLIATEKVPDGDFWKDDAIEVFINANGDEMSYIEFETSPLGLIYDACVADYRPEVTWLGGPQEMTHLDIEKSIVIYKMHHTIVKTRLAGTLNNPADVDQGWTCEIAMSWADLKRGLNFVHALPPADGDLWRIGLFRGNINTDKTKSPDAYSGWNPTTSWYHGPWLYGRVIFQDK